MDANWETLPRDIMRALGFLTRLPIPAKWFEGDDGKLSVTARAFPTAAALSTIPSALVLIAGTILDLPVLLSAAIAVAVSIAIGGALHEDGLADTADGFFGGFEKDRRLEIMKDSRIGAFGAMAMMLALVIKVIALAAILQAGLWAAIAAMAAAAAAGRTALVWHWSDLPSARADGTADKAGQPTEDASVFALVSGLAIAAVLAFLFRGIAPMLAAAALAIGATMMFRSLCATKIGGHTGDTLGAAAILAELGLLAGLASGL
ncbi:MAG: adenosylcobinamide-GDP ribazoletransferase [Rhizobiaceae bacterium]